MMIRKRIAVVVLFFILLSMFLTGLKLLAPEIKNDFPAHEGGRLP